MLETYKKNYPFQSAICQLVTLC